MGQRTCMIVKQRIYNRYEKQWKESIYVFHEQWGIGKCLPMDVVNLFMTAYRKAGLDLVDYTERLNVSVAHSKAWNCTGDYGKKWEETQEFLSKYDFRDMGQIKEFIDNHHDNNNGGVYIEITCPNWDEMRIDYAFFSGCEEEKKGKYCDKGLTYKQWMNNWKKYKNKDFDKIWDSVCKYCGVQPFVCEYGKLKPSSVYAEEQG